MNKLYYLYPYNNTILRLTKVKYSDTTQNEFNYVVGFYPLNKNKIKLFCFENKEIVILDENKHKNIEFSLINTKDKR